MANSAEHIAELERVLEATKSIGNELEFWAFRGAFQEVAANISYLKRRRAINKTQPFAGYLASLESLYEKYENVIKSIDYNSR